MTKEQAERENWAERAAKNGNGGVHRTCGSVYQKTVFELKNKPGEFETYWECHTCVSDVDIQKSVDRLTNRSPE